MHGCSSNRKQDYEISYAPSLKVWLLTLGYAPRAMLPMCIKERKWGPPHTFPTPTSKKEWGKKEKHTHTLHPLSLNLNEWKALVEIGRKKTKTTVIPPLLTFNGNYVFSDLVLQCQVIDALDQVVDCVNVRVDRLEPMDLCPDGRWVGQNKLRAGRAGLCSLARNSPRTELTSPWACRRSGSELGRDRLGHWDGNRRRDRAWSGHGWLRLLRDTGHGDVRLKIHLLLLSRSLSLTLSLFRATNSFTAATQIISRL